ncbi:hypothetical protein Tco_1465552 [Tanacetum coccineum]
MQLVALPSPDYVPGPEHPLSPVEVPYVPEPEYREYLVPSNAEAPLEDQPLPTDALPTTLSPSYVADFDPDEGPEEDPKGDHADYPADGGDGNDEPSDDDDDDDDNNDTDDEEEEPSKDEDDDEEEEEEHLAPADSSAIPVIDPVPSVGDTDAFETEESTIRLYGSWDRMRAADASPPLSLLPTSPRTDIPEAEMPPRKRACLTTPAPGYEIGESSAAGAARQPGPTPAIDTWDEIVEAMMEIAPTTLEGVDQRVTELDTTVRQRTEEFETSSEERSAAIEAHVRTLEAQVATLIAQTTSLQTQLTSALGHIATLEARDPEPQDGPAEAGRSTLIDQPLLAALAERDASRSRGMAITAMLGTTHGEGKCLLNENALTLTFEVPAFEFPWQ